MIKNLEVSNFKAVPYLESSILMSTHKKKLHFSVDKPNAIVGPNGAGKSALLNALALLTLSYYMGESAFDDNFVVGVDADAYWEGRQRWGDPEFMYLPGLTCDSDNAPAIYYRPSHIPGNDDSITAAMMCGYFKEAREYAQLVEKKSSGQQSQALLEKAKRLLSGEDGELRYQFTNWRAGETPRELKRGRHICDFEYKAEELRKTYSKVAPNARPLLLMDEPEQSLDAKAEVTLWDQIAHANCSKVQVIVATHSLYPIMHPEHFNIIEAVPGYVDEVRALM